MIRADVAQTVGVEGQFPLGGELGIELTHSACCCVARIDECFPAALAMAWYRPDLYRRVLTYSGTYVNQQWPWNPETSGGAWEFHRSLIPGSPVKPIRLWLQISDRDNFSAGDGMHDWVLAN